MNGTVLNLPSRPCPRGCGRLTQRGLCSTCAKQSDRTRGTATARGYGSRWARTSATLRRRTLRWCGDTMPGTPRTSDSTCPPVGIQRQPSEVIDHIVPVDGPTDPRFWQSSNWQGLCHACHNRKRSRERFEAGRRRAGP